MLETFEQFQPARTFAQTGGSRGRYAGVNAQLKNVEDTLSRHTANIEVCWLGTSGWCRAFVRDSPLYSLGSTLTSSMKHGRTSSTTRHRTCVTDSPTLAKTRTLSLPNWRREWMKSFTTSGE